MIWAMARELTVSETYFFRHHEQLRAMAQIMADHARRVQRPLRVLSAGCASGEEPYTLAILLREQPGGVQNDVVVRGIDLNPAMLERARRAVYSSWSLRETPEDVVQRWFVREGREYALKEPVRSAVTFEERNLFAPDPLFWSAASYDAVFCRNVLMYMTPRAAQAVVAQIARALVPGGYLFLGFAETLRGLSQDFHLRHTHGAFYYERRGFERPAAPFERGSAHPAATSEPTVPVADEEHWVDAIARSAQRIEALSQAEGLDARSRAPDAHPSMEVDLRPAMDLLRCERFAEALALVQALPPGAARDADALLLRALLLIHNGKLGMAEQTCSELLELDALAAGAHYLLALCSEARGDKQRARDHDQIAIHLDPGFVMARLHLGLVARRLGDQALARRELGQALVLLPREDAARLSLFGGGFERAVLVALCRAELVAAGGTP